jgi:hypothetical protein
MAKTTNTSTSEPAPQSRLQTLAIAKITLHRRLQSRERINPSVVAEYEAAMEAGDQFPPLLVFYVGSGFLLVDGFHRLEAAKLSGLATLRCEVRHGGLRDAIMASAAVNATHGLRRTWADKRIAVGKLLQDHEWVRWSDREIARRCMVSPGFVGQLRDKVTVNVDSDRPRLCRNKHGTVTTMNTTAIGSKPKDATPIVHILSRPDDRAGEVVSITAALHERKIISLSDELENLREQFVADLAQIEKLTKRFPAMCTIQGNLGTDSVLAERMKAAGKKLQDCARMLMRRPSDVGQREN